jgi:hypothetical protein
MPRPHSLHKPQVADHCELSGFSLQMLHQVTCDTLIGCKCGSRSEHDERLMVEYEADFTNSGNDKVAGAVR